MSRKKSTRQLIGIDDITNGSVVTTDGELAFYFVHPSNLNVLPEQGVRAKVQELLGVLKGMAELELLALDSKESFQDNRQFYRHPWAAGAGSSASGQCPDHHGLLP